MDVDGYIEQWRDKEIVAFSGGVKYRGTLTDVLGGGFVVLSRVAIMSAGQDTAEYDSCVLNLSQVSGVATEELSGRGVDDLMEGF